MADGTRPPRRSTARSYPGWIPALARLVAGVFFSRIEVLGREQVPPGPVLYVANHNNGLIDPLLVVGCLPGRPRFLAKSTLWRNPVVRPFLALARVIPIHRRQDPGFDPAANLTAFAACERVLAEGGAVALFPEGRSHSEPALGELRTGAARILSGLAARHGPTGVRVVPVGLHFDDKSRFRSRVLVLVGEPLDPGPSLAGGEDDRESVRALTERIASALAAVTPSFASWEEARLLSRAAQLYQRGEAGLPRPTPLSDAAPTLHLFATAYARLRREAPDRVAPLADAIRRYDRHLAALGVEDEQVAASYPPPAVTRFLTVSALLLAVRLPAALVGVVLNVVPYRVCGWLGALVARQPDQPATYKLFGGIVLYPLTWLLEGVLAARWGGWPVGAGVAVLGPAAGLVALRFRDRWRLLREEAGAFLRLRLARHDWRELRALRRDVRERLLALAVESGFVAEGGGAPQ